MTDADFCRESAKRCEKCGKFPTWHSGETPYRVQAPHDGGAYLRVELFDEGLWHDVRNLGNHEAACIFERFWREELQGARCGHQQTWRDKYHTWHKIDAPGSYEIAANADERVALLAAVDAALIEKEAQ